MNTSFRIKAFLILMISALAICPSGALARQSPAENTTSQSSQNRNDRPYGGTLVWGAANKPMIINPVLTQASVSAALMGLIFDSLVRIDHQGKIVPGLAQSWDISEDGLIYTFHLRKGVLFHDGAELTAEDVKFTYDLMKDPAVGSVYRTHLETVDRFEAPDSHTFRIVLREPFTPLIYKMVRYILPKHLLEDQDLRASEFNYYPIGTGSFRFDHWDRETDTIELKANSRYFEGRPYLDRIIVKTYADNSQLMSALMRSDVDMVFWINRDDYDVIRQDPVFKTHTVIGAMYYALVYDLNDPVWHEKELRRAVAHGINVKEIIDMLSPLEADICTGPFHPKSMGHNPDVQPLVYDPVKARMMLMHAGWQDAQQDSGVGENYVRRKGGRELELRVLVDRRNETYKRIIANIRQQLSEIGVKTVVIFYENEKVLTPEYIEQSHANAWLRLFLGQSLDPYESSISWFSESDELSRSWNYRNSRFDELFELGRMSREPAERAGIYQEIHNLVYDDQPACFLFYPAGYFAVNSRFHGTEEYFNLHMPTHTIKDWHIFQE